MPPFPCGDSLEPRLPILPDFDGGNAVKIGVNSAETKPQMIHLFLFVTSVPPPTPLTLGYMMPPAELISSTSKTCEVIKTQGFGQGFELVKVSNYQMLCKCTSDCLW